MSSPQPTHIRRSRKALYLTSPASPSPHSQATVGGETVEALGRLHCDVVFLGTNGLTPTHGLSTPDPDEATVKRAMVRSARRKVVLADSSKVGATLLISFASLSDIDVLVTDSGLPEADRQQLVNEGLEVVVA